MYFFGINIAHDTTRQQMTTISYIIFCLRDKFMFRYLLSITILISACFCFSPAHIYGNITTRIKDISNVQGVRDNYLFGYGLVIGLQGSGDKQTFGFTTQLAKNVFEKLGSVITTDDFISKNIAGVLVTAKIRPFRETRR